jgi:hypothetical protein
MKKKAITTNISFYFNNQNTSSNQFLEGLLPIPEKSLQNFCRPQRIA